MEDKIDRIEAIITATEDAMLNAATNSDTKEYRLDDGQTKINVAYQSMTDMTASITKLEQLKHYYINQINGYQVRTVDFEDTRGLTIC